MAESSAWPRITFGIIVLNGEPFTRYCLRALYPLAHQIIVVEGAAPGARNIATPDGHSRDATLDILRRFSAEEDPDRKLSIVTAEDEGLPNGFWPGEKDQMSAAYASRATGHYLWQVDIDEFYRTDDMRRVIARFEHDPSLHAAAFKQIQFWGGFDSHVDGWYSRQGNVYFHRLFRWGPGYQYQTHRPPTVVDDAGRNLRTRGLLHGEPLAREGIFLYHYSLVFPHQVQEKCDYYKNAEWSRRATEWWQEHCYNTIRRPYRLHNVYRHPGWLERFTGEHPEEIQAMREDIDRGRLRTPMRPTDDIERLLSSRAYARGKLVLKCLERVHRPYWKARLALGDFLWKRGVRWRRAR